MYWRRIGLELPGLLGLRIEASTSAGPSADTSGELGGKAVIPVRQACTQCFFIDGGSDHSPAPTPTFVPFD